MGQMPHQSMVLKNALTQSLLLLILYNYITLEKYTLYNRASGQRKSDFQVATRPDLEFSLTKVRFPSYNSDFHQESPRSDIRLSTCNSDDT